MTEPGAIAALIRSQPDTPRHCVVDQAALSALRQQVGWLLVLEHLKPLQAPVGVDPILKCWMELN